jgi:hypothetical protein
MIAPTVVLRAALSATTAHRSHIEDGGRIDVPGG